MCIRDRLNTVHRSSIQGPDVWTESFVQGFEYVELKTKGIVFPLQTSILFKNKLTE